MNLHISDREQRRNQLVAVAEDYFEALRQKDFSAIPYDQKVTLRAPLTAGGVNHPLEGVDALRTEWWEALTPALSGIKIKVLDHYLNDSLTAIITEAEIIIHALPSPVTLRVADRFTVNEQGKIIEQENHFDPRDVTQPGWQTG
jgi:hypothetical protein